MYLVDMDDLILDTTANMLKFYKITPPEGKYNRAEVFQDAKEPLPANFWLTVAHSPYLDMMLALLILEGGVAITMAGSHWEAHSKYIKWLQIVDFRFHFVATNKLFAETVSQDATLVTTNEDQEWAGKRILIPAPWNSVEGDVLETITGAMI